VALPANTDRQSQRAIHQLLGGNIDPDSEPEGDGGDDGSANSEVRILRKEVNELREKFGHLKGRIDSLPEVIQRDLKMFKDDLIRDLSYSLGQRFGQIDQNILDMDKKVVEMDSDIKALGVAVAPLVQNIQNMQISINQYFKTSTHNTLT
jgi:SMC interacting uncharacterized protein involved in chromosome segregation